MVAYTYSRARDVQSFTSSTAISNWQFGRTLSGRQEDAYTGISLFDQPHKIIAHADAYLRLVAEPVGTDVTSSITGVSGAPHDYIYDGSGGAGDMNGDGVQGERSVLRPEERARPDRDPVPCDDRASRSDRGAAGAGARELHQGLACLNSRSAAQIIDAQLLPQPVHNIVDLSAAPEPADDPRPALRHRQLDIFNFGNLLNKNWGKRRFTPHDANSNVPLVTHVAGLAMPRRAISKTAAPVVHVQPPPAVSTSTPERRPTSGDRRSQLRYELLVDDSG